MANWNGESTICAPFTHRWAHSRDVGGVVYCTRCGHVPAGQEEP